MPRRNDIHRILIVGSGPIVIGQACEFDYSGTQAAKALRADGYEVILVNSNPATIMTDPISRHPTVSCSSLRSTYCSSRAELGNNTPARMVVVNT